MGNILDSDEYPGANYMIESRKRIISEKYKNESDQLLVEGKLENWRKIHNIDFRKNYVFWEKNPEKLVILDMIPTWHDVGWTAPTYAPTKYFKPPEWYEKRKETTSPTLYLECLVLYKPQISDQINKVVSLYRGDITKLEIDAIQNAANTGCLGGGGIDGAIHNAAGDLLVRECAFLNGCKTGRTRITKGYRLPALYILHTVGPTEESASDLESCYVTTLKLCLKYNLRSVALCCVSTGIFGYPREKAGHVAMSTVRKFLEIYHASFDRVIFIVFETKDEKQYNALMPLYFPCQGKTPPPDPTLNVYIEDEARWYKDYCENWSVCKKMLEEKEPAEVEAVFAKKCGYGRRGWVKDDELTEEQKKEQADKDKACSIAFGLYLEEPIKITSL